MTLFQTNDQDNFDPDKNYLEDLVGEGKKYKDEQALARSRVEADNFIKRLERENAEMRNDMLRQREQLDAGSSLQELLDQLKTQSETAPKQPNEGGDDNRSQQVDMKEIETLFSNKLKEHESNREQTNNYNASMSKIKERYGDNYLTPLKTTMDKLNLSESEVDDMARRNPVLFGQLFAAPVQTENFQAPPSSNRRSDSFAPTGAPKRDEAYYEKIRTATPDVYWSPKTQNQMHKDAEQLGDSFFVN